MEGTPDLDHVAVAAKDLGALHAAYERLGFRLTMLAFGLWVLASALWGFFAGSSPQAETMGAIGSLAFAANVFVALMLYRYRAGDANMRSVWICSRNDAIGNLAVLTAALGVFGTGQGWPDLAVAAIMAALAIWGSIDVFRQARGELAAV